MNASTSKETLARCLRDPVLWCSGALALPLRGYQARAAKAIAKSIGGRGGTHVVTMSRQAGKNQLSACLESWLLARYKHRGGSIVKTAPSFRPQLVNSMNRLAPLLDRTPITRNHEAQLGYIYKVGRAQIHFLSGAPKANIVGATASLLLEADEAQDMDEETWYTKFVPMASSTNAPMLLYGTAWTDDTLLQHTIAKLDPSHVHRVPWQQVANELPAYGQFVQAEIARLGWDHPIIQTQYELNTVNSGQHPLLDPVTLAMMHGTHAPQANPCPGSTYRLLIDPAGHSDDQLTATDERNDYTAALMVEIMRASLNTYRAVHRWSWQHQDHALLAGAIATLAEEWNAPIIMDATGLGQSLYTHLSAATRMPIKPIVFTSATKSEIGWTFLGICKTGRFLDHTETGDPNQARFWQQAAQAQARISGNSGQTIQWNVPDRQLHDDHLIAASLCSILEQDRPAILESAIIEAPDPLERYP